MRNVLLFTAIACTAPTALATDECAYKCGITFEYCVAQTLGNDMGLEFCGESLVQCQKRCEANPQETPALFPIMPSK
jgi:hypothetical protein